MEESSMKTGLYSHDDVRDNCGFGMIAHMRGEASHHLLLTAIESLTRMTHRGAVAADGKTGDGCGVLIQKPDSFLREEAKHCFGREPEGVFAVGQVFLDQDESAAAEGRAALEQSLTEQGLKVMGWRAVPTDASVLGEIALRSVPRIEQIFVEPGELEGQWLRSRLLVARRKAELARQQAGDTFFYVASLSVDVIIYKGLVMPEDLPRFYLDLADERLATAICIFHQRFSTNTLPRWALAHPFRMLAHNGEINTIVGNRNWAIARTSKLRSELLPDIDSIGSVVNTTGSDSSSLDNMLELLVSGGMPLFRACRMLVPPAWQNVDTLDSDERAFHEYNSLNMEPWDGPAGIVMTDGRYAVCMLDRNGLRPARYVITDNGYITLASEIGTYNYAPETVVRKGRVGPGQLLAIDTQTGEIKTQADVDSELKAQHPYKQWLRDNSFRIESLFLEDYAFEPMRGEQLDTYMKQFQISFEERDQVLRPLAELGQEAVGSMGDDTPMAVLSKRERPLYDYFRQQFAQVTNPPIDPLRESIVMSLETDIGPENNVFEDTPEKARRVLLTSPLLSPYKFNKLLSIDKPGFGYSRISLHYDPQMQTLEEAIVSVTQKAEREARAGSAMIVLSDAAVEQGLLPIHALLATGAVHHHLIAVGLRCDTSLIIETGTARDPHHIATLIGFGATAVYPYLSYSVLCDLVESGEVLGDETEVYRNYRKGINKGLMKILSKMGISTIASYRAAQLFEAVGLSREVVDLCFKGLASRVAGARFVDLENDQKVLASRAWNRRKLIEQGGLLKYVHGGEYHAYNPDVVQLLHAAVRSGDYAVYKKYAKTVNERPTASLRDLLTTVGSGQSIPLDEVEPVESILKRFDSAGMSLGALSPEAHEALAVAMNRLGGRSNSGEGGEDPSRFNSDRVSKIKQIASGRFGVTPEYLVNAEVLQIKIAQGAKPGEGGQLPGGKVNGLIARLRYSLPGVTLISPPPHHDIYSIEDLAQLIFDLKQINPKALVSVKLVSEPGVGTIATGVAKAYADLITISGYDGGTGASPLTSIRYAGSPWELGLSETNQALRANNMRGLVRVQTDGGLKTGLDVIKAAMLGAESFGFGTAPMVALGCKYLRICHLNNCATGVATQNDTLRDDHFLGTVEMVMNFFRFVAQETRELMAELGIRNLSDIIGQTHMLERKDGATEKQNALDLSPILYRDETLTDEPNFCTSERNPPFDKGELAEQMVKDMLPAIEARKGGEFTYDVHNYNRSIGARVSGEIALRYGNEGLSASPLVINLNGTAGQSLGVWNAGGVHIYLKGDANDYVGKGMAGGKLVLSPPEGSKFSSREAPIMGNTCLYGATGGKLLAAGTAGERFAVRNSGCHAVVEGTGDHCCEYMTGGVVTVLGPTGHNFGAGMTGGFAYVLDMERCFADRYNHELVEIDRISVESYEAYRGHLHGIVHEYAQETGSAWGREIDENFEDFLPKFWLVKPKAANIGSLLQSMRASPA